MMKKAIATIFIFTGRGLFCGRLAARFVFFPPGQLLAGNKRYHFAVPALPA